MRSLSIAETTTDLVRLRRWAMAQLCRQPASELNFGSYMSALPEESWRTFLSLERCASPLVAAVLNGHASHGLPSAILSLLKSEAVRETECVLRAERDARWIATFSREAGAKPIALKGLLPALAEAVPPLHLFDLDILATSADERVIAEKLAGAGFKAATNNEIHHVYWAPPAGHLPVELHQTVFSTGVALPEDAWARVTAVSGVPGMYRLAYADQMHHMLHHILVQHSERHVRIRDLLLMSWVMLRMDANDYRQLGKLIDGLSKAREFRALMKFAARFGESAKPEDAIVDPYENDAILFFAASLLAQDSVIWSGGPHIAWQGAASVAAGRNSVTDLAKFAAKSPVTGIKAFSELQRMKPAAGQAITRMGRAALYFTSATLGSPVLLAIRREVIRRLKAPLSSR